MAVDILGAAPWAILTAGATWAGAAWKYRDQRQAAHNDKADRLEIHRDELTFELLRTAQTEIGAARLEVEGLRAELSTLRSLETHYYHFQQALEHLEAMLRADPSEIEAVRRNASAFVTRMRRLNEAKGTVRNEAQIAESTLAHAEKTIGEAGNV